MNNWYNIYAVTIKFKNSLLVLNMTMILRQNFCVYVKHFTRIVIHLSVPIRNYFTVYV